MPPEHQEETVLYMAYLNEKEWLEDINRKEKSNSIYEKNYVAFKCDGKAQIEVKAVVKY